MTRALQKKNRAWLAEEMRKTPLPRSRRASGTVIATGSSILVKPGRSGPMTCHRCINPQEGVQRLMPTTDSDSRKLLVKSLEDVYAIESHLVQVLSDHVKDAQDEPVLRQKIEQHLRETELHRDRIEQRLHALGAGKPGFKTTVSNVMSQVFSAAGGSRANPLAKDARDTYASEHLEIAC